MERAKRGVEQERAKRLQLERECAVYQSQLEEFQRKIEVEKSDRRVSDARALQLLQEVKEKGKLAQQLREEQARYRIFIQETGIQRPLFTVEHFDGIALSV